MFGSVRVAARVNWLCPDPSTVRHEREGKKGGLNEAERGSDSPPPGLIATTAN